jgi:hypothetical protein
MEQRGGRDPRSQTSTVCACATRSQARTRAGCVGTFVANGTTPLLACRRPCPRLHGYVNVAHPSTAPTLPACSPPVTSGSQLPAGITAAGTGAPLPWTRSTICRPTICPPRSRVPSGGFRMSSPPSQTPRMSAKCSNQASIRSRYLGCVFGPSKASLRTWSTGRRYAGRVKIVRSTLTPIPRP